MSSFSESSGLVVTPTYKLITPESWTKWYIGLKNYATALRVWKYIDPESEEQFYEPESPTQLARLPRLSKTHRGSMRGAATSASRDTTISEIEELEQEYEVAEEGRGGIPTSAYQIWFFQQQEFRYLDLQIQKVIAYIDQSVSLEYASYLILTVTPREKIRELKRRIWPGLEQEQEYATDAIKNLFYQDIQNTDVMTWLHSMDEAVRICVFLNCDLMLVRMHLKDVIGAMNFSRKGLSEARGDNGDNGPISDQFFKMLAEFRDYISFFKPLREPRKKGSSKEAVLKAIRNQSIEFQSTIQRPQESTLQIIQKSGEFVHGMNLKKSTKKVDCLWCENLHQDSKTNLADHWKRCYYTLPFRAFRPDLLKPEISEKVQQKLQNDQDTKKKVDETTASWNATYTNYMTPEEVLPAVGGQFTGERISNPRKNWHQLERADTCQPRRFSLHPSLAPDNLTF